VWKQSEIVILLIEVGIISVYALIAIIARRP
jgi:hypothetical protein